MTKGFTERESAEFGDGIRIHQAVYLVQMAPIVMSGNLFGILTVWLNSPDVILRNYVYIFFVLDALLLVPMLMSWLRLRKAPWPEKVGTRRIRRAAQHAMLMGLNWAAITMATFPFLDGQQQSMYIGVMAVLMVGGAAAISRVPATSTGFGVPVGLVLLACAILYDQSPRHVVTVGVLVVLVAYVLIQRAIWHSFVEHVRVTDGRRKLQDRLTAQEEASQAQRNLLEALPFPLVVTRGEMALFASPTAVEVFGLKPTDLHNPAVSNRRYFARDEDFLYLAHAQMRGELVPERETLFVGAKGRLFWALVSCRPIMYEGETAWVNAILPIDERKKVEYELAKAKEAAEHASHAKTDFLASMSHELRTPLNAIIGYSEILLEEAEDDGHENYAGDLRKIRTAGRHILALINDILDITKIEAGKMEITPEHVGLNDLIGDVTAVIRRLMEKNGNVFTIDNRAGEQTLWTDVTKTRQTILNLLSNAAKFTREGKVVLRVDAEHHYGAEWLRFIVTDTGIGIPPEKINGIFDEFNRGDSNTARHFGGTGLGLALSRKIARLLGGDITARSTPGQGSTFEFTLPLKIDVEAEETTTA